MRPTRKWDERGYSLLACGAGGIDLGGEGKNGRKKAVRQSAFIKEEEKNYPEMLRGGLRGQGDVQGGDPKQGISIKVLKQTLWTQKGSQKKRGRGYMGNGGGFRKAGKKRKEKT